MKDRSVSDARHTVSLTNMVGETCLGNRAGELYGRSVLLAIDDQLISGIAMMEIDGNARRMLLCPPGLDAGHLSALIADAEIDAVVTDQPLKWRAFGIDLIVTAQLPMRPAVKAKSERMTQWLMLTSGTSGVPKIVRHTLEGLTGAIVADGPPRGPAPVWATFYDIRRYGGLQIFLRAILGGGSMVLSEASEPIAQYLSRLCNRGVTHISGTPSHWRKLLMSRSLAGFTPRYVRLSGEIADQAVLDGLACAFPSASIGHAYASTEAGVGFAVNDGREGFPAEIVGPLCDGVELAVTDGSLRIRSKRTATDYVGRNASALTDANGFVDTGDMVELRGERYLFVGRRGGIINIGGLKVHPEEVEAVINRHPGVRMSRAKSRRNPITGSLVVADIVLADGNGVGHEDAIRDQILAGCRKNLAAHKVPAIIKFVSSLDMTTAGKLARQDA